jgi:hypothetical protein
MHESHQTIRILKDRLPKYSNRVHDFNIQIELLVGICIMKLSISYLGISALSPSPAHYRFSYDLLIDNLSNVPAQLPATSDGNRWKVMYLLNMYLYVTARPEENGHTYHNHNP